jgi:hypothetical protein
MLKEERIAAVREVQKHLRMVIKDDWEFKPQNLGASV